MIKLVIWTGVSILGVIPTIAAVWRSYADWRAFDIKGGVALGDFIKEELIRELIIAGGQVLTLTVAVVSFISDLEVWEHSTIVWLLVPLPVLLGLLSYHSNYARQRAERRLPP